MKKKKKIDFGMIILLVIMAFALYGIAQIEITGSGYVNYFGYTFFQVITGSMEPTIMTKDIVIEKITDDVHVNDIITFKMDDNYVTHRIIQKEGSTIITRGDNNNADDKPIEKSEVVGKVVFIIPNVAIFLKVIKTPKVIIAFIISIVIIKLLYSNRLDEMLGARNSNNDELTKEEDLSNSERGKND